MSVRPNLCLTLVLAEADDLMALLRWGRSLPPEALFLLRVDRTPCHAVYHYVFKPRDGAATEAVLGT